MQAHCVPRSQMSTSVQEPASEPSGTWDGQSPACPSRSLKFSRPCPDRLHPLTFPEKKMVPPAPPQGNQPRGMTRPTCVTKPCVCVRTCMCVCVTLPRLPSPALHRAAPLRWTVEGTDSARTRGRAGAEDVAGTAVPSRPRNETRKQKAGEGLRGAPIPARTWLPLTLQPGSLPTSSRKPCPCLSLPHTSLGCVLPTEGESGLPSGPGQAPCGPLAAPHHPPPPPSSCCPLHGPHAPSKAPCRPPALSHLPPRMPQACGPSPPALGLTRVPAQPQQTPICPQRTHHTQPPSHPASHGRPLRADRPQAQAQKSPNSPAYGAHILGARGQEVNDTYLKIRQVRW